VALSLPMGPHLLNDQIEEIIKHVTALVY